MGLHLRDHRQRTTQSMAAQDRESGRLGKRMRHNSECGIPMQCIMVGDGKGRNKWEIETDMEWCTSLYNFLQQ